MSLEPNMGPQQTTQQNGVGNERTWIRFNNYQKHTTNNNNKYTQSTLRVQENVAGKVSRTFPGTLQRRNSGSAGCVAASKARTDALLRALESRVGLGRSSAVTAKLLTLRNSIRVHPSRPNASPAPIRTITQKLDNRTPSRLRKRRLILGRTHIELSAPTAKPLTMESDAEKSDGGLLRTPDHAVPFQHTLDGRIVRGRENQRCPPTCLERL